MNAKEIIKELDPEYGRCRYCKSQLPLSVMKESFAGPGSVMCIDEFECSERFEKKIQDENERINQRTGS